MKRKKIHIHPSSSFLNLEILDSLNRGARGHPLLKTFQSNIRRWLDNTVPSTTSVLLSTQV